MNELLIIWIGLKGSAMNSNTPTTSLLSNTSGIANSSLTSINNNRNPLGSILQPTHQQQTAQTQSFTQVIQWLFLFDFLLNYKLILIVWIELKANQVQSALGTNPPGSRIGSAQSNPLPNAAQLRVLVQQIQLAVQAGHLNAQVRVYHNLWINVNL